MTGCLTTPVLALSALFKQLRYKVQKYLSHPGTKEGILGDSGSEVLASIASTWERGELST